MSSSVVAGLHRPISCSDGSVQERAFWTTGPSYLSLPYFTTHSNTRRIQSISHHNNNDHTHFVTQGKTEQFRCPLDSICYRHYLLAPLFMSSASSPAGSPTGDFIINFPRISSYGGELRSICPKRGSLIMVFLTCPTGSRSRI